jgi:hypothetical protein
MFRELLSLGEGHDEEHSAGLAHGTRRIYLSTVS